MILVFILLFSVLIASVPTASASIYTSGAEAVYEESLSNVEIPTQPKPLGEIFTINEEAELSKDLISPSFFKLVEETTPTLTPEVTPTHEVTPTPTLEKPEEKPTPGFEAVLAIVGLLSVLCMLKGRWLR